MTQPGMAADASTSSTRGTEILVLHPASVDPAGYITRLLSDGQDGLGGRSAGVPAAGDADALGRIPWTIDNKYYSAQVTFCPVPQEAFDSAGEAAAGYEVVMYLFSGQLHSLPPALVRSMAEPRDIALAVRIPRDGPVEQDQEVDDLEDMFGELGVEFLDDSGPAGTEEGDDDDERPMPIVEQVRQTLMTHMWPNMVRKPLSAAAGTRGIDEDLSDLDIDADDEGDQGGPSSASFPTSFAPEFAVTRTVDAPERAAFPGLDELRSQIMLQDTQRMSEAGFSRLDMMDNDDEDDWVQAEYSRLDEWLDDGEGEGPRQGFQPLDDGTDGTEHGSASGSGTGHQEGAVGDESLFEDDFADFAPFQSAPQPSSSSTGAAAADNLPLDPTPLLLHLQNVREELAGLDEDTRRVRAGKEVETLLRSLGMGGLDFGDENEFAGLAGDDGGLDTLRRNGDVAGTK